MTGRTPDVIVVGVDGSPSSTDALRWAIREAEATGVAVRAVTAWEVPTTYGYAPSSVDIDFAEQATKANEQALAEVIDAEHPVTVTSRVTRGHAATILVEESRDASLLVVGSRGHGTAIGMLLGSVSLHCVQHAACPVVVIRPRRNRAEATEPEK